MIEGYIKGSYIEPHTLQWQNARLGHFTASEWNKLFQQGTKGNYFGTGAMSYIEEKVAEIMTGQTKEVARGIPALDWGIAHEADAADAYSIVTGYKTNWSGFYEYSPVFGGTPDREIDDKRIVEFKCPHVSTNFIKVTAINSGEEYRLFDAEKFAQCQGNMLVTNTEICDMVYFDPRMGYQAKTETFDIFSQVKIIPIYRDDAFIKLGLEKLEYATEIMIEKIEAIIKMQDFNREYKFKIAS